MNSIVHEFWIGLPCLVQAPKVHSNATNLEMSQHIEAGQGGDQGLKGPFQYNNKSCQKPAIEFASRLGEKLKISP